MDFTTYQPAPEVLERLQSVDLAGVIGPSAAGKTTLINEALRCEPGLHLVMVHTSRLPRPEERDGVDYHFQTRAAMEERLARREFVQVAPSLFGDLYATAAEDYAVQGKAVMAILADAMPSFRALPFRSVQSIFVLPPDWDTWQARLRSHHFNADKLAKRIAEGEHSLRFALTDSAVRFVINGNLQTAVDDFITLALGKPLPARLQADQGRARALVRNLLGAPPQ